MKIVKTRELSAEQKIRIFDIWNREYPDFLMYRSMAEFENYLGKLENADHFMALTEKELQGWIVKFDREAEKWFVLMVSSRAQGQGVGQSLLRRAMEDSDHLNGWVIESDSYVKSNGEAYRSPLSFYTKNGFLKTEEYFENDDFRAVKMHWNKPPKKET